MHVLCTEAAPDIRDWGLPLAQLGIAGLVLWYVGVKLLPRLLAANEQLIVAFRDEARLERESHAAALAAQRAHDESQVQRTHERLDDVSKELSSARRAISRLECYPRGGDPTVDVEQRRAG